MKFRFCGDGDCPDWVLAEIHSNLSVLTSPKLASLAQLVVKSISGDEVSDVQYKEAFTASTNDPQTIKSAVACLRFLLTNATRFQADKNTFSTELEQLGLPKEHSAVLSNVFSESSDRIYGYLSKNTLSVNELINVTSEIPDDCIDCAQFTFDIKNELVNGVPTRTTHKININKTNVKILLNELKTVQNLMEELK